MKLFKKLDQAGLAHVFVFAVVVVVLAAVGTYFLVKSHAIIPASDGTTYNYKYLGTLDGYSSDVGYACKKSGTMYIKAVYGSGKLINPYLAVSFNNASPHTWYLTNGKATYFKSASFGSSTSFYLTMGPVNFKWPSAASISLLPACY